MQASPRRVVAGIALVATTALPCVGEESLVIVDGTGAVLGPVMDAAPVTANWGEKINQFTFVYRQGAEITLLRTDGGGTIRSVFGEGLARLYYSDSACSGDPVMATPQDCCQTSVAAAVVLSGTELWEVDYSVAPSSHLVGSFREAGASYERPCQPIPPINEDGNPVELWGTFEFTPPVELQLNPLIFNDGFGTGNGLRWSGGQSLK